MIAIHADKRILIPLTLCDCCQRQLQGAQAGYALLLISTAGHSRTTDLFFAHLHCEARFLADHPAPTGAQWMRADIHELLRLLDANTEGKAERVPVALRPRLH